jgi:hypothetical protein
MAWLDRQVIDLMDPAQVRNVAALLHTNDARIFDAIREVATKVRRYSRVAGGEPDEEGAALALQDPLQFLGLRSIR